MKPEELLARREQLLQEESTRPERWWWLSFADAPPDGFLGAVLIRARGFASAVELTWKKGINPGGEVRGAQLPDGINPPLDAVERLLSRSDIEEKLGGVGRWE